MKRNWWVEVERNFLIFFLFFLNIQRRIVPTLRTDLILKSTTCLGEIFIEKNLRVRSCWSVVEWEEFLPMPIALWWRVITLLFYFLFSVLLTSFFFVCWIWVKMRIYFVLFTHLLLIIDSDVFDNFLFCGSLLEWFFFWLLNCESRDHHDMRLTSYCF